MLWTHRVMSVIFLVTIRFVVLFVQGNAWYIFRKPIRKALVKVYIQRVNNQSLSQSLDSLQHPYYWRTISKPKGLHLQQASYLSPRLEIDGRQNVALLVFVSPESMVPTRLKRCQLHPRRHPPLQHSFPVSPLLFRSKLCRLLPLHS